MLGAARAFGAKGRPYRNPRRDSGRDARVGAGHGARRTEDAAPLLVPVQVTGEAAERRALVVFAGGRRLAGRRAVDRRLLADEPLRAEDLAGYARLVSGSISVPPVIPGLEGLTTKADGAFTGLSFGLTIGLYATISIYHVSVE